MCGRVRRLALLLVLVLAVAGPAGAHAGEPAAGNEAMPAPGPAGDLPIEDGPAPALSVGGSALPAPEIRVNGTDLPAEVETVGEGLIVSDAALDPGPSDAAGSGETVVGMELNAEKSRWAWASGLS